jgi:adenylate kinase
MAYAGKVVVVAGPPCSGKGTQCKRLAAQLGLVHVSTGDVFRDAVARRTPLGLQAKGYMDRGRFVPDELMIQFVTDRLAEPDVVARGCLLDGFPRTGPQARTLAAAVKIERFVVLQVPDKALQTRAIARRIDPVTGDIYNLTYVPPPADVVARLEPRQYDDDAGTFQIRLDVYHKHIRQIIPSFGQRVWMVDAMRPPDAVFGDLARCLEATAGAVAALAAGGAEAAEEAAPAEAPPQFCCAITQEVMHDPVTTADGHVYEREAISTWLREHTTSPLTGQVLKHKQLTAAPAVRATIEEWAGGAITAEEALSGSSYTGPGTANNPVARTSAALDALPASTLGMPPVGAAPEPEAAAAGGGGAEAAVERVEVSIVLSGDGEGDASGVQHVVVNVTVDEALHREPIDICCVIDVSGSMGEEATHEAPDGTIQSDGLSILDLVKHAVKTMAHMMEPEDRLALVAFSNTATMLLPPTPMGDAGRANALLAVESLLPDGATNLWDGLKTGLDCLRTASLEDDVAGISGRKSTVLLLTDGVPNEVPDGGHNLALSTYKDAAPDFRFQVNTLGFGSTLDSDLLSDIATLGDGIFAFIPDSKIMGTVFVNCLSNVIATATQQATLSLTTPTTSDGAAVGDATIVGRPLGHYACSAESWGLHVDLGPLQYGQTRSIAVPMAIPSLATAAARAATAAAARAGEAPLAYLEAKLEFSHPDGSKVRVVARPSPAARALEPSADAVLCALRCDVITTGRLAIAEADADNMDAANAAIRGLVERFAPAAAATAGDEAAHAALLLLQSDVEGRLSKALSRKERFERWGKHYLRALLRAHELQLQTNFMDPGLKSYGGELFVAVRDVGGLIFAGLPAPQPPPKTCPICGDAFGLDCSDMEMQRHTESHFGGPPAAAAPVRHTPAARVVRAQTRAPDMADFYQGEGGGCFGRGSTCMVASGNNCCAEFVRTDVTAVRRGDLIHVAGGGVAEVVATVTIAEPPSATLCELPGGLRITAKHPIRTNSQWTLPSGQPDARIVRNTSGFVTNFVLKGTDGRLYDHGHVLLIDGVECASWGHGLKDEGITHAFWGSERVVEALSVASFDANAGRVVVRGCMHDGSGEVVGFVA